MDLDDKIIGIQLVMTAKEWCRLCFMAEHVAEEAHDGPNVEPWNEQWWKELAELIVDVLKDKGVSRSEMAGYDKIKPTS